MRFRNRLCPDDQYFTIPKVDKQPEILKRNNIFDFSFPAADQQRRQFIGADLLQIAVVLGAPSHGQHQQLKLVVFPEFVFLQHLADILPVLRDDALPDPDPTPIAANRALTTIDKR